MDVDLETVDRLLTTTRAVRKRLDLGRAVAGEVITECVRIATQAPSAADAQNWHWVAVSDPGTRKAIADVQRGADEEFVRGQLAVLPAGGERRRMESALYLLEHLHEVPVHVLAYVVEPDLEGLKGQALPPAILYGSIFPAVWSFQLALRARGLGTTPIYVGDQAGLAAVIGSPPNAHFANLMPVAYYTGETFKPAPRRPVEDVLAWNSWSGS